MQNSVEFLLESEFNMPSMLLELMACTSQLFSVLIFHWNVYPDIRVQQCKENRRKQEFTSTLDMEKKISLKENKSLNVHAKI